jgi:hypothetical protein
MPYDNIVASVFTMLLTPRLGIVHVANLAGRVRSQSQPQMRSAQSKSSKLIPPRTQGSRSRPCSNVMAEQFLVSPNHFQGFCVAHLDADSTSDLPADVAQQG